MAYKPQQPMTYQRREQIFSKEALHYTEIGELMGIDPSTASKLVREMKRKVGDKLHISGRILVEEYLKWRDLNDDDVTEERKNRTEVSQRRKEAAYAEAAEKAHSQMFYSSLSGRKKTRW